jgi:hypothetical protein
MTRTIVGVIAGVLAWAVLIAAGGVIMRSAWPAYAVVAESMSFTLPMLIARLSIGAVALLAAARLSTLVATKPALASLILGIVLLIAFIPIHINLWDKFPLRYHLTFLLTLIPLSVLGGQIGLKARRPSVT